MNTPIRQILSGSLFEDEDSNLYIAFCANGNLGPADSALFIASGENGHGGLGKIRNLNEFKDQFKNLVITIIPDDGERKKAENGDWIISTNDEDASEDNAAQLSLFKKVITKTE